ncbi:hypothetical protein QOZ80_5BG0432990 [Eleusine coracana subsp. coracana]|nr:hypothetical protein QOZ80_5BG0432990 [Eleusine coracana subsp. coracana]
MSAPPDLTASGEEGVDAAARPAAALRPSPPPYLAHTAALTLAPSVAMLEPSPSRHAYSRSGTCSRTRARPATVEGEGGCGCGGAPGWRWRARSAWERQRMGPVTEGGRLDEGSNQNNITLRLHSSAPQGRVLGYRLLAPSISSKRSYNKLNHRARAAKIRNGLGAQAVKPSKPAISRSSFPSDFIFGAATSSYQIEGAWNEDGKGLSTWDHYCHTYPYLIKGGSNGDVAVDSYHIYPEDVKMLKAMGMDAYRFSICWPRILPNGTLQGGINKAGIDYYNKLINLLIENGIKPYVTLFHWETPQALDEKYHSFLCSSIVKDFKDYAEVCFDNFGDRVKQWFTFNEPYVFCCNAYGIGKHAPGRCSPGQECAIQSGNSLTEPYRVGHNLLLAHAEAPHLYRDHRHSDGGQIGMALVSMGYEPYDRTEFVNAQAQARSIDYNLGWFMEPVVRGDYPFSMRSLVGSRLPYFTEAEQEKLVGSYDMMGLNYYTSRFSTNINMSPTITPILNTDDAYSKNGENGPDGKPIGPNGHRLLNEGSAFKVLFFCAGVGDMDDGTLTPEKAKNDTTRLNYIQEHIAVLKQSIDFGSNVRGHFTWSLLDNFEWQNGYTQRFGLIYVDRNNNFERSMKKSAEWFAEFNQVGVKK